MFPRKVLKAAILYTPDFPKEMLDDALAHVRKETEGLPITFHLIPITLKDVLAHFTIKKWEDFKPKAGLKPLKVITDEEDRALLADYAYVAAEVFPQSKRDQEMNEIETQFLKKHAAYPTLENWSILFHAKAYPELIKEFEESHGVNFMRGGLFRTGLQKRIRDQQDAGIQVITALKPNIDDGKHDYMLTKDKDKFEVEQISGEGFDYHIMITPYTQVTDGADHLDPSVVEHWFTRAGVKYCNWYHAITIGEIPFLLKKAESAEPKAAARLKKKASQLLKYIITHELVGHQMADLPEGFRTDGYVGVMSGPRDSDHLYRELKKNPKKLSLSHAEQMILGRRVGEKLCLRK